MSLANDQNCAISEMLKMPTQMKKATPTYGTPRRDRQREQLDAGDEEERHADEQLHAVDARRRTSRRAGTNAISTSAWPAAAYDADFGAAAEQDQRLAHDLDDRIADEEQEDVEEHQDRRRAFARVHLGEERQRAIQPGFPGRGLPSGARRPPSVDVLSVNDHGAGDRL